MFATMDADSDGFVTQDEAKAAHQAMRDQAEAEGRGPGQRMFEMADTDGDGKISADEFAATAPMKFERMDANGDGVITKDEVQHKSHGMGGCDGDKA
jgi:hypothetical protein